MGPPGVASDINIVALQMPQLQSKQQPKHCGIVFYVLDCSPFKMLVRTFDGSGQPLVS